MGYYVHNKYDKTSIAGLSTTGAGHTLVDFYTDYETYKYLDTSKGFGVVYDTLEYITPNSETGVDTGSGTSSHFNFASSIIIKHIQRGVTAAGNTFTIDLAGFTNIDKMICLLFGGNSLSTGYGNAYVKSLSTNTLVINSTNTKNVIVSYQVIEFK